MLNQPFQDVSTKPKTIKQIVLISQSIDAQKIVSYFQKYEMLSSEEISLVERIQDKIKTLS